MYHGHFHNVERDGLQEGEAVVWDGTYFLTKNPASFPKICLRCGHEENLQRHYEHYYNGKRNPAFKMYFSLCTECSLRHIRWRMIGYICWGLAGLSFLFMVGTLTRPVDIYIIIIVFGFFGGLFSQLIIRTIQRSQLLMIHKLESRLIFHVSVSNKLAYNKMIQLVPKVESKQVVLPPKHWLIEKILEVLNYKIIG